jgi:cytochrome c oxidase subunit 2
VRGTGARGTTGPDLTHIASRRTLAAGTLPNTSAHLGTWIARAQSIKPGSLMPDIALEPPALRHIHAYMMSLR